MVVLLGQRLHFDTTLRDGEQTPGVSLTPQQKLESATALSDIGMDVIEVDSAGERDAMKMISEAVLPAEICTFVWALQRDIAAAADFGAD